MKRHFFVYSLPRSGSSWLSVFLSMPGSYCYHEPFADGDLEDTINKMYRRPEECVGLIDTSAHQRELPRLNGWYYFVLHRHKHEVASSLRIKGWVLELDKEITRLDKATEDCVSIYYHWLSEISYLESIWKSITGGLPFDRERAEYLTEMNIQRTFASVAKRHASYWNA